MKRRLTDNNIVYTPGSGTTAMINYSRLLKRLEVEFRNKNRVYHYYPVPLEVWEDYVKEINAGESSGVYVNTKIKGFYDEEEIT